MAIMAQSAQAMYYNYGYNYGYNNYGYNRNNGGMTYTGMATHFDENGTVRMIPVS